MIASKPKRLATQLLSFVDNNQWNLCNVHKRFDSNFVANKLTSARRQVGINNSAGSKQLRTKNTTGSLTPQSAPKVNQDIQKQIRKATHSKQISKLIHDNNDHIMDASIYGKAMLKTIKLKDYDTTKDLFDQLLKSGLDLDVVQFTIFFNGMSQSDEPSVVKKYFKLMIEKYKISPSLITISTLIKSCRSQGLYHWAIKYWKLLEIYNIKPNEIVYTEILSVCSKSLQKETAIEKWTEYQKLVHHKKLTAHLPTYSAYLSVFARCGDVDGMQKVLRMIQQRFRLNNVIYGELIQGYLKAKQYEEAIDAFDDMITKGIKPGFTEIFFKLICMFQILNRDKDILTNTEKLALYEQIGYEIHTQLPFYDLEITPMIANIYLGATIVTHYDSDPMEIVKVIDEMYGGSSFIF